MTPEAVRLVRESWAEVEPTRLELAEMVYGHLFRIAPDTRRLFSDLPGTVQAEKFADMMLEIIRVLDRPYQLLPELTLLGKRHAQYGVTPEDYAPLGDALLLALEERLGDHWTPRLGAAWREAYLMLAQVMVRATMRGTG